MNKLRLPWLLAACTAGIGSVHAQQIPPLQPKAGAISSDLAPLANGPAIVKLTELYDLLTSKRTQAIRSQLTKRSVDSSRPIPAIDSTLDIAFVDTRALRDSKVQQETVALFDAGMPIAAFSPRVSDDEQKMLTSLFGAASQDSLSIYVKKKNEGVRIFSTPLGQSLDYPDVANRVTRFQQAVADQIAPTASQAPGINKRVKRSVERPQAIADRDGTAVGLPIYEVSHSKFGPDNQFVTNDITLVRDFTPSTDKLKIIVKTSATIKGATEPGNPKCSIKLINCAGPEGYQVLTKLQYDSTGRQTDPALNTPVRFPEYGESLSNYRRTVNVSTNYSYNLSKREHDRLQGQVSNASVKTNFGYAQLKKHTKSIPLAFNIRDYGLQSAFTYTDTPKVDYGSQADVYNKWNYFLPVDKLNRFLTHDQRVPEMNRVSPQTYSEWTIEPPVHRDWISIETTTIANQHHINDGYKFFERMRSMVTTVSLRSPYLHREPVVLLQSKDGHGRCLNNLDTKNVELRKCSTDIQSMHQQWYLDAFGRYVSRLDGRCLTIDEHDEREVFMADCNQDKSMKWQWTADRITSKFDGGAKGWRLFVDGFKVKVRIRPELQQIIPANPHHPLLAPWSTYPSAPHNGATIPVLDGTPPQVPEQWVQTFEEVPSNERWEPIPLRQYGQR